MVIKTERLNIRLSSDDEMQKIFDSESDDGLKLAYSEMLNMSVNNHEKRQWYAMWFIESKNGKRIE